MIRLFMLELYARPFRSLAEYLPGKIVIAVLLSPLTAFLDRAVDAIMGPPPTLVVIIVLLYLVDLVAGIRRTIIDHGITSISSYKLRQTIAKAIDYTLFAVTASLVASMGDYISFGGVLLHQVDEIGLLIVGLTEARSIDENLDTGYLEAVFAKLPADGLLGQIWSSTEEENGT